MNNWVRCVALAAGLALLGGTVAGCDDGPVLVHEATSLSEGALDGVAHDLRLPATEVPALEKQIPDTTVADRISDAVKGLDTSAANGVVAKACQLAGMNLGQPPPESPNFLDVSKAEQALKDSKNSGDESEMFAAWAMCNASEAADQLNQVNG